MEQSQKPGHDVSRCEVEVIVNEQKITMTAGSHTVLEIKEDAIKAGLSIDTDFVLSIEDAPRRTRVLGDRETIDVTPGCRFVAIPDDDNS